MPEKLKRKLRARARELLRTGKADKLKGESDEEFIDRYVYGMLNEMKK